MRVPSLDHENLFMGLAIELARASIMQMNLQAIGVKLPGQFFNMMPYLATIIVLVFISSNKLRLKLSAPASLNVPFEKNQ